MTHLLKVHLLLFFVLVSICAKAQKDSISLIEAEFTVRNNKSEIYYFGLSQGDIFSFSLDVSDAAIKGVEFCMYPDQVIFSQNYVGAIKNKSINIYQTGIYFFRFYQSGFLAGRRHCRFEATRILTPESMSPFNTTVYWNEIADTVWYFEDEEYISHIDTLVNHITSQSIKLKKRGKEASCYLTFSLPATDSLCAIWIATGKDGLEQFNNYEKQQAVLYPHIEKYGLMADIAMRGSFSYVTPAACLPVSFWILEIPIELNNDSLKYMPGKLSACADFKAYDENRIHFNHLLLLNENKKHIWVHVKITSVKIIKHYGIRKVKKYRLETIQIPYLKN